MNSKRNFVKAALFSAIPATFASRLQAATPDDTMQNKILAIILAKKRETYEDISDVMFTTSASTPIERTLSPGKWRITATSTAHTTLGAKGISLSISTARNRQDNPYFSVGVLDSTIWGGVSMTRIIELTEKQTLYIVGYSFAANINQQQTTIVYWERIA